MGTIYNAIGVDYAAARRPDPRLGELIRAQIVDLETVLNVGAGAGSYEPDDKSLIALEPSWKMISQRSRRRRAVRLRLSRISTFPGQEFRWCFGSADTSSLGRHRAWAG